MSQRRIDKRQYNAGEKPTSPDDESATIALPLRPFRPDVYSTDHIDVHLNAGQARALRRAFDGLYESNYRLRNGRFVSSPPDVIRWILEAVESNAGLPVAEGRRRRHNPAS